MAKYDPLGEAGSILLNLRSEIAAVRIRMALKKFNPDQPRWPAGQSDGGQWRPEDGMQLGQVGYDPSREAMCEEQRQLDHELCRMARTSKCWESADFRYNNCVRNAYIPPLEVGR